MDKLISKDYTSKDSHDIDWPKLVFTEKFMSSIEKLVKRRFGDNVTAEESSTKIIEYISYNDWERCKQFRHQAKPSTFLYTLATNALEEFARQRYGRKRPPSWLKELGGIWIKLWQNLCLERQPVETVIDKFCQNDFFTRDETLENIKYIKKRLPNCGACGFEMVNVEDINILSDSVNDSAHEEIPDKNIDNAFHKDIFLLLKALTHPLESSVDSTSDDVTQKKDYKDNVQVPSMQVKLEAFKKQLTLSDQEILLLKLVYVQGLSKCAAAKVIGVPSHQGGRILNATLTNIRKLLAEHEIDLDCILKLF